MAEHQGDLIIRLAHGLAVALELYCDPVEMNECWDDELQALKDARDHLQANNLAVPTVILNVLKVASGVPATT